MKKIWVIPILVMMMTALAVLPASATRPEGINGFVEHIDSQNITVAQKTYRVGKLFRVVIVTRDGVHRYEKEGTRTDVRVGDKVSAVVLFDEMGTIYLERY